MARKRRKTAGRDFRLKAQATRTSAGTPEISRGFRPQGEVLLCAVFIVAAGIWAYANSVNGVFLLDDIRAIVQNQTIRSLTLSSTLTPPPASTVSGRPFANLTFAINYAISALDTRSYHIVNILIHLCAALVLFGVVRRTLITPALRGRFGESATLLGAVIASIWTVHPLTTSAVTYVVQRVESLMSLFYLLTLYAAIRADAEPRRRTAWTAAAVISCALGMTTKEVMVTAPVAVLLWDLVFRRGERPRWGLFGALVATWLIFAVLVTGEHREASVAMSSEMIWRYLLTQSGVLLYYLRLAVIPSPLIFLYTWPLAASVGAVWMPLSIVTGLLALTIAALWKRHPLGYLGAWVFVILAPTSSVIPIVTEVAAEHRMYLPLAAVVAAVVATLFLLVRLISAPAAPRAIAAVGLVLVIFLGVQTRERNLVYATEEGVWRDTVDNDPGNERARVAYGTVLGSAGRIPEAESQFQRAVELNEGDGIAQGRLGSAQAAQGKFDTARVHLERALAINPDDVEAHKTLGRIYALQRDDTRAVSHLERALRSRPDDPQLLTQMASILAESDAPSVRNPARALQFAEEAVRRTSRREATALDVLALAYARNGRLDDAVMTARDALEIARAAGNDAAIRAIEARLGAYESRRRQLSISR